MSNIVYNFDQIHKAIEFILLQSTSQLICFQGDLGSGKTTLIKAMIQKLGAVDSGASPTFGLVNEYYDAEGDLLAYHLDCYRLKDEEEALDIGIEEYLEADCWVFVEWPDRILSLLPERRTEILLKSVGFDRRDLQLKNLNL